MTRICSYINISHTQHWKRADIVEQITALNKIARLIIIKLSEELKVERGTKKRSTISLGKRTQMVPLFERRVSTNSMLGVEAYCGVIFGAMPCRRIILTCTSPRMLSSDASKKTSSKARNEFGAGAVRVA